MNNDKWSIIATLLVFIIAMITILLLQGVL